jgi:hypothetical protein
MSANNLLLFLSARGEGSWQQFRAAVEELHLLETEGGSKAQEKDGDDAGGLPLHQLLRLNLQRLGHVEFFAGASESDWRTSPPAIAMTRQRHGWLGVLAGARSPSLMRRVQKEAATVKIETLPFPAAPDQFRIIADDQSALAALAGRTDLLLQEDAPLAILASLTTVDNLSLFRETELPIGNEWVIDQFSTRTLTWRAASREIAGAAALGLFRFSLRHRRHMLLRVKGRTFEVPGQVGKFIALRHNRRKVFGYEACDEVLSVPAGCRPPFLVERALILCSGKLPSYDPDSGKLRYYDVNKTTAELACGLLRQELR